MALPSRGSATAGELLPRLVLLAAAFLPAACSPDVTPPPPFEVEIERPVSDWQLAVWASPYRGRVGDSIDVYVRASHPSWHLVQLFRMGAFGVRRDTLLSERHDVMAGPQAACAPAEPGPVECPWSRTLRIGTDSGWPSGVYVVQVSNRAGQTTIYPFVLTEERVPDFYVVVPQFTWQAYNTFGGSSLYRPQDLSRRPTVSRVSFERPYDAYGGGGHAFEGGRTHELAAASFMQQSGFDVAYISDIDLAAGSPPPRPRKGVVFAGHDEYWTLEQFDLVREWRDAGVHLAFMSGNNAYWRVVLEPSRITDRPGQVLFCRKDADWAASLGPERFGEATTLFRLAPLHRPEQELMGIMYSHLAAPGLHPLIAAEPSEGTEARAFLDEAGIAPGDSLPSLVGSEGDRPFDEVESPGPLQVLFRSPSRADGVEGDAYLTTFVITPSGAGVFASGNNEFARGLDERLGRADPRLQRLMVAVFRWMLTH